MLITVDGPNGIVLIRNGLVAGFGWYISSPEGLLLERDFPKGEDALTAAMKMVGLKDEEGDNGLTDSDRDEAMMDRFYLGKNG